MIGDVLKCCISPENPLRCLCALIILPLAIVYTIFKVCYDELRICCCPTKRDAFGRGQKVIDSFQFPKFPEHKTPLQFV